MGDFKSSKTYRILKLFEYFNAGAKIKKKNIANNFNVSNKTVQRDIKEINNYFQEIDKDFIDYIEYDYSDKVYFLKEDYSLSLTKKEVMAIIKILLESRSLSEDEIKPIIDKLLKQLPYNIKTHVNEIMSNELFHYKPVSHEKPLLDIIWKLSHAIRKNKVVKINYCSLNKEKAFDREIEPLGLMFSEYYFYLIAHHYGQEDDFKIVYRLDRINDLDVTKEHFKMLYKNRFQEGEFRKRIQFMYPGKLMKIRFKFWGASIEAVLDKLPTAKVIERDDEKYTIEAEVYGKGIKMWLLSQGEKLEVLRPESFRKEIKDSISKMENIYN
jgi:predicted DNA-binding transcriptional regulator YafY